MGVTKMSEVWIVDAVRTPIGRLGGCLSSVRPDDLAAVILSSLAARNPEVIPEVEEVFLGCANQAGEDNRDVARMALLLAGLPEEIPASTMNRLCGSGLDAIMHACRGIMVGDGEAYLAGGVESMSRAPWAIPKPERGFPTGSGTFYDTSLGWRFVNRKLEEAGHTDPLGITAENLVAERFFDRGSDLVASKDADAGPEYDISRERQDRFALASHQKAVAAWDEGRFDDEVIPVEVSTRKSTVMVDRDEGPRADTSLEKLNRLRPAFKPDGTVTAGNSSSLNDGAAGVLLVSERLGRSLGLVPMAKLGAFGTAGVPPRVMGIGPVPASEKALKRAEIGLDDVGLIELNEAFAAQALAVLHEWRIAPDDPRLNVNGGAIALGHPLGCSGARILTTLLHEMKRRPDCRFGLATMCIGVGQGIAAVVERVDPE